VLRANGWIEQMGARGKENIKEGLKERESARQHLEVAGGAGDDHAAVVGDRVRGRRRRRHNDRRRRARALAGAFAFAFVVFVVAFLLAFDVGGGADSEGVDQLHTKNERKHEAAGGPGRETVIGCNDLLRKSEQEPWLAGEVG
jgi:hypothetical protein